MGRPLEDSFCLVGETDGEQEDEEDEKKEEEEEECSDDLKSTFVLLVGKA